MQVSWGSSILRHSVIHVQLRGNESVPVGAVKMKRGQFLKNAEDANMNTYNCKHCGSWHQSRKCPVCGKQCTKCKRKNHSKQCFSKEKNKRSVHLVEESDLNEKTVVGVVTCENVIMTINGPLQMNGSVIPMKLDTGAKVTLICMSDVKSLKEKPHIRKKSVPLKAYNGQMIDTKGMCRLKVEVRNRIHNLMFVIVPGHDVILGDQAWEHLELVKRVQNVIVPTNQSVDVILKQLDVFTGLGVLRRTYQIQLKGVIRCHLHKLIWFFRVLMKGL